MQRLRSLVRDERVEFVLVRVRDDDLVGVDHREPAGLDILLLRKGQQVVEELLVAFEHLDEFHHAAVRNVQLPIKAEGPRVRLHPILTNRGEVDAAGQLRDVLALGVRRSERANADAIFFGEGDPLDQHVLHSATEAIAEQHPTVRT